MMLPKKRRDGTATAEDPPVQCGLCGKSTHLTKTACCGHWICDDYDSYEPFSLAQVSCQRNHERYTLCAAHFDHRHPEKDWRRCAQCRLEVDETEMYVWLGTNAFNFLILKNPPPFRPTQCAKCGCIIRLGSDGYRREGDRYACTRCSPLLMLEA